VYTLNVSDKFGDSGLTGIAIIQYEGDTAIVDSFLMSCRVIGRGIEFGFWHDVVNDAKIKDCKFFQSNYLRTLKNEQVADFYDRLGIPLLREEDGKRSYRADIREVKLKTQSHVEIIYDK